MSVRWSIVIDHRSVSANDQALDYDVELDRLLKPNWSEFFVIAECDATVVAFSVVVLFIRGRSSVIALSLSIAR